MNLPASKGLVGNLNCRMTSLKTISVENLKEKPEETFYAINGMRFVIEAFENSVCSLPSQRIPIEPIPSRA